MVVPHRYFPTEEPWIKLVLETSTLNPRNFLAELKRRNVYKVAVAYAVVGWLVMQVTSTVVPALHLPDGITSAIVVLTLLGFPIALVIAWAFEMTPEGMKRTENVPPNEIIPQWSRRKFATFIAIVAAALVVYRFARPKGAESVAASAKSIAVLPFENLSSGLSRPCRSKPIRINPTPAKNSANVRCFGVCSSIMLMLNSYRDVQFGNRLFC